MNAMKIAAAIAIAGLIPGIAFAQNTLDPSPLAQDALRLNDVNVVQQPQPAHYQPDATDYDLVDRGKTFNIDCMVGADGRMHDCTAEPNGMADQNFVRIGVDNARDFIVGAQTRDGSPTAGRTLSLTCRFNRADGDAAVEQTSDSEAANDKDLTRTAVAVADSR